MSARRRRSHAPSRKVSVSQSWFALVAFVVAIVLIFMFNRQVGDSAAGCLSSGEAPDAGAPVDPGSSPSPK